MRKHPVTTLLSLAFAFVLLLMAAIGSVGLYSLNLIDNHLGLISEVLLQKYTLMMDMRQAARERSLSLHRMIMLDDPFEQDAEWLLFNQQGAAFALAREKLVGMKLSEAEQIFMEQQGELIRKNVVVQMAVAALAMAGDKEPATAMLTSQALPAQNEVFTHIDLQLELYAQWLHTEREAAGQTYRRLLVFGLLAGGMALLSGLWVAIWSVRQIGRDQRELVARQREQSEIIDGMMTGVMTINERGVVESFNRAAMEIFGYRAEEVVGKNLSILLPEDARKHHDTYLARHFSDEASSVFMGEREVRALRSDGTVFPLRIMLSRIPAGEDGRRRVVASCFDITEQKEQELRLRSSQKMDALGKLTGGIAHDYNNMLAVILGYVELLMLRIPEGDALRKYVTEIQQAAERGSRLTSKLLAFTRRKPLEVSLVDINALLQDDRMMLEKTLTAAVSLRLQLGDAMCLAALDRDDLANAILNITINARHAMPNGGVLTIETRRQKILQKQAEKRKIAPGEYVELSITDTGVGMDEETVGRIFEPFFSTKGDNGTGLGMSQVYGFMKRSGGDISVTSTLGQGTCFVLLFPCRSNLGGEASSQGPVEKTVFPVSDRLILVVDDEPALREMTAEMLQAEGYRVVTAEGAEKALSLLQREPVELLLSDVIMPGMNGYQLAAKVEQSYPQIKIQMMSGYSDSLDNSEVDPRLARQLLRKPFSGEELRQRVHQKFSA